MNKKGFISTSIIYSFFLVFILLMIAFLMSFTNKRYLLNKISETQELKPDILECTKGKSLRECLFKSEYIEYAGSPEGSDFQSANDLFNDAEFNENSIKLSIDAKSIDSETKPNFNDVETKEVGMYAAEDDYGTSYYYRGAENDNYVFFAGHLWRIIRVNGNGTIRIILDEPINSKGINLGDYDYPTLFTSNRINLVAAGGNTTKHGIGYMMSNSNVSEMYDEKYINKNSSDVKGIIGAWYDAYIGSDEEAYLDLYTIFCGDKDIMTKEDALYYTGGTGEGILGWFQKVFGTNRTIQMSYFGAMPRLAITNPTPTVKCPLSGTIAKQDCNRELNLSSYNVAGPNYKYGKRKYDVAKTWKDWGNCGCKLTDKHVCANDTTWREDKNIIGNGRLNKPVATISADEIVMAGGVLGKENKNYYLFSNDDRHTWSMTPGLLDQSYSFNFNEVSAENIEYIKKVFIYGANVNSPQNQGSYYFALGTNGELQLVNSYAYSKKDLAKLKGYVRPVVNLHKCVKYTNGSGTQNDPYLIEEVGESC